MKKVLIGGLVALFLFSLAFAQDKPASKDKPVKTSRHEMKKEKKDCCGNEKGCCQHMKESKEKPSNDNTDKKDAPESPAKK